jgi:gamma-glutamyltranspeptidase / glutathione hydrolase
MEKQGRFYFIMLTLRIFLLLLISFTFRIHAQPIFSSYATAQPVTTKQAMVATQEPLATNIGIEILKQGGNAVDAAVAVGYALAVTLPRAGNIGGGGFMVVHLQKEKRNIAIDFRETAPLKTDKQSYFNHLNELVTKRSRYHGLAVGVPGTVMGLELARKKYGTMSRQALMLPAIQLAKEGFPVSFDFALSLKKFKKRGIQWPSTQKIFFHSNGQPYQVGEKIVQLDLANSLQAISDQGEKAFYEGDIAKKIVAAVQQAGGHMTLTDLKQYRALQRKTIQGSYKGLTIHSMPPPSSGGIHLLQMLNVLKNFPLEKWGHNSAKSIHVMAETMKYAFADRSIYLGDPAFVDVPTKKLLDSTYANKIAQKINIKKARPSVLIAPPKKLLKESNETTHYSVVDKQGNATSVTYTLNFSYGSGLVAKGTGILLNNEIDDFSIKTGTPNAYGLTGGLANEIVGGKRPLSSMTPFIALKDNKVFLIGGSPGGSRIITTCLQLILNVTDYNMNIAEATQAQRIHHQWLPDELHVERNLNPDVIKQLKAKGHKVVVRPAMGNTQSILREKSYVSGASDPRGFGHTNGY